MKEIQITKYIADNGKEFYDEEKCKKYEREFRASGFKFIPDGSTIFNARYIEIFGPYGCEKLREYNASNKDGYVDINYPYEVKACALMKHMYDEFDDDEDWYNTILVDSDVSKARQLLDELIMGYANNLWEEHLV